MSTHENGSADPEQPGPEDAIEPALPIIDPHHHVWDRAGRSRYLFPELLADLGSGHDVVATVAIECGDMYRADAAPELRAVGETEFLNGIAAMFASGKYGRRRACAGIVGMADLRLGDRVQPVLDAHIAAGGGRFRGIRVSALWHASYTPARIKYRRAALGQDTPEHLLLDPALRAGFACLAPRKLSCDITIFHAQIPDVIDLARAFPGTDLIVGHYAMPLGLGPYAGKYREVFGPWRAAVRELARCPNVHIKFSGIYYAGVAVPGYVVGENGEFAVQPNSSELAAAWHPYVETCIEAFGPQRCMYASNYPPEKAVAGYVVLWNAYKRIAAAYTASEKAALFSETAARVYRLPKPSEMVWPA